MYTVKPSRPDPALTIRTNCASLRRPWWTIPEADHLQMHACTRRSTQLRLKAQYALLHSLHTTALYRRMVIANK